MNSLNSRHLVSTVLKRQATYKPWATGVRFAATETPSPVHGSYHWLFERVVAVNSMVFLTGMLLWPESAHSIVDLGLTFALPLHGYQGVNAVITDYLPRRKFPVAYPLVKGSWILLTIATIYGLWEFNKEGPGICAMVKKLWKAQSDNES